MGRSIAVALVYWCVAAGCAVTPQVVYRTDVAEDFAGLAKFQVQRSSVLLHLDDSKGGGGQVVATSVPADSLEDPVYAISPVEHWGVSTVIKLKHRENSFLLESLGSEVEDHRVEMIQEIGAIAVTLAKAGALSLRRGEEPPPQGIPAVIDVTRRFIDPVAAQDSAAARRVIKGGDRTAGGIAYEVEIGPVSKDAIAREAFFKAIEDKPVSVFFFSACRDVQLELRGTPPLAGAFNVRISDPNFIQTVALPAKGKVDVHAGCGVDVTSEHADIASSAKVAGALLNQVKALRDAAKRAQ